MLQKRNVPAKDRTQLLIVRHSRVDVSAKTRCERDPSVILTQALRESGLGPSVYNPQRFNSESTAAIGRLSRVNLSQLVHLQQPQNLDCKRRGSSHQFTADSDPSKSRALDRVQLECNSPPIQISIAQQLPTATSCSSRVTICIQSAGNLTSCTGSAQIEKLSVNCRRTQPWPIRFERVPKLLRTLVCEGRGGD